MARRLLYTLIPTHLGILSTLPKQRANSILKTEMNSTQSIYIEITQYILHCHRFFVIEHRLACHRYNYTKIRISSVLQSREEKKKKEESNRIRSHSCDPSRWVGSLRVSKSFAFSASLPRNLAETLRFEEQMRAIKSKNFVISKILYVAWKERERDRERIRSWWIMMESLKYKNWKNGFSKIGIHSWIDLH